MKGHLYVDLVEVIKHKFGDDRKAKQKFADFRNIQLTQLNRWIAKGAHVKLGKPDGQVFLMATTHAKHTEVNLKP